VFLFGRAVCVPVKAQRGNLHESPAELHRFGGFRWLLDCWVDDEHHENTSPQTDSQDTGATLQALEDLPPSAAETMAIVLYQTLRQEVGGAEEVGRRAEAWRSPKSHLRS